jgi:adenylyltransferase/sulfurtransferase
MLTPEEYTRYSRQITLPQIGLGGQQKLKAARVLVVGAGGLGCPALLYLVAAGVGTIGLADGDVVEASNLQRQVLYSHDSVGKKKVAEAARVLSSINPLVKVVAYDELLTAQNAEHIIPDFDVVIDATDAIETRYLLDECCVQWQKPWIYGGVYQYEGQLSVFNYPVNKGVRYAAIYPKGENLATPADCALAGVLGVLPGIIGTMQAAECIKIIVAMDSVMSGKLVVFNMLSMHTDIYKILV